MNRPMTLRSATTADAAALHQLIAENLEVGHLLPRTLEDLEQNAHRFVVVDAGNAVVACADDPRFEAVVADTGRIEAAPADTAADSTRAGG